MEKNKKIKHMDYINKRFLKIYLSLNRFLNIILLNFLIIISRIDSNSQQVDIYDNE